MITDGQRSLRNVVASALPGLPHQLRHFHQVHRAAHLLSNDNKLLAAQMRQTYETLLAEMEQAPTSSELLATMLSRGSLLRKPFQVKKQLQEG